MLDRQSAQHNPNTNTNTMNTCIFCTLTVWIAMHTSVFAQTVIEKKPWTPKGSVTLGYQDLYFAARVSKPVILVPNLWVDLSLEWDNGFYCSWTQYESLDRGEAAKFRGSEINEAVIAAGYKWKWDETTFRLQSTLISLHPYGKWWDDERLALELYVSRTFKFEWEGQHTVTPELRLGWFSLRSDIDNGVPFAIPSVMHVWDQPFGLEHLVLRSKVAIGIDSGFNRLDSGQFWQIETGLQWKLRKNLTLTLPGWKFIEPFDRDRLDGRGLGHDTFFTSLTYRF